MGKENVTPTPAPPEGDKTGNDNQPKMVLESDLIAAKRGLQTKVDELTTQLTDSQSKGDGHYQSNLKNEQEVTRLTAELKEAEKLWHELEGERTAHGQLKESTNKLQKQLLDAHVANLAGKYGVPAEKLEGKTIEQLAVMEEALQLAGIKPSGSYDGSAGGGGADKPMTSFEKMVAGLSKGELPVVKGSKGAD